MQFHAIHENPFVFPNDAHPAWSIMIVLYPYITGLVAGAFILASLERVFNVRAVKPTYRLSLLTALAFLMVSTVRYFSSSRLLSFS